MWRAIMLAAFLSVGAACFAEELWKGNELLDRAMRASAHDAQKSLELFTEFVSEYPHSPMRQAAYFNMLPLAVARSDSTTVHAIIDSFTTLYPGYNTDFAIARALVDGDKYLATASHTIERASMVLQGAATYVADNHFQCLKLRGRVQAALERADPAKESFREALSAFSQIDPAHYLVRNRHDVPVYVALGELYEQDREGKMALRIYREGLRRDSRHAALWNGLKRTYEAEYGSLEEYDSYKESLTKALPEIEPSVDHTQVESLKLPDFRLRTLDGDLVSLDEFRGKVLVLNFWAYWCGPCIAELPTLDSLSTAYDSDTVSFVSVHSLIGDLGDLDADLRYVRKALEKAPVSYPVLFQTPENYIRLTVTGIPTTFIVDRQGVARYRHVGYDKYTSRSVLEKLIAEVLEQPG